MINFAEIGIYHVILCAIFVLYRWFKQLEGNDGCGYFIGTLVGAFIIFSILSVGGLFDLILSFYIFVICYRQITVLS